MGATSDTPYFSVLLPLQETRDLGASCLSAWLDGQTFPSDRYEVVVLAPGIDPELERRWRSRIANHDQWIEADTTDEYELFNVGARQARGRFLLLTEAHCVPLSDCLEAMHAHLEQTGAVGARGRTLGEPAGSLGVLEHTIFDESLRAGEELAYWEKVLIHSFAIRRDTYLEAGGLDPSYGDFSPWVLSVVLWEQGHRLGFTPDAQVRHRYVGDLKETEVYLRNFTRGEIAFRDRFGGVADRYLHESREWRERWKFSRDVASTRLRATAAAFRPTPGWMRRLVVEALASVVGSRVHVLAKHIEFKVAKALLAFRREPSARLEAYRGFWYAAARLGAIEWLAANPPGASDATASRLTYDLTETNATRTSGVDVLEEWEGKSFRWSGPVALVEVSLPDGAQLEGRLDILPIRAQPLPNLRIALGGRAVPRAAYRYENGDVVFPVRGGGVQWLSISCDPLRPRREGSTDWRALGLPLRTLSFRDA